ncbi:hypothetical protein BX666DRAFT_1873263 [Dichotomocladium elegans]|nr:hypothetical protein BX666DRAFT_1873263 [Dichotomocladium elegans]
MEECLQELVHLEHLQSLKLSSCNWVTPAPMVHFLRQSRSQKTLKNVDLDSIPAVTNEVLRAVGQYLTVLERLYVGRCFLVKDSGVRDFVDTFEGQCLRELVFGRSAFAWSTTFSRDTVSYAQLRFGPRVIVKEIIC